jgi:hypothetical protein
MSWSIPTGSLLLLGERSRVGDGWLQSDGGKHSGTYECRKQ